ncbi:Glucose-1-phosphate thymidylyltransferase [Liberibacter crescens BT-1]|uniref:Glucose-1-phosphate thymidylyltransferase n=1 Tax=Liberibacter crescens (strain BT-1) TaxID=1215343 RepID=L0ETX2_LIBCB|nr:glucose-1-phosphate thymidylyltransferase RfbA [Liberibacter crescens]AGA64989.1 Glucose-1-phosphate thymidylyltransferase [Liberibacter crescens BT-1]AMC13005.1 glucose-1-phosphate thymidylyltransferase [Liberibacter crescens]
MKGIILAGGNGSRLNPMTSVVSKQMLPVYNKPMIYYPLTTLMEAGIHEILIISTPRDLPAFKQLLGSGKQWGINLSYVEQPLPGGLAQAYILGADFIGDSPSALILGDNIFYGDKLQYIFQKALSREEGATVIACSVPDPERYGVVELDASGKAIIIEEKPDCPKTNLAVTGFYFYDKEVVEIARQLKPSIRGELEITDINCCYLKNQSIFVEILDGTSKWIDTGTPASLADATVFIRNLEENHNIHIGYPEEVAYRQGFISMNDFVKLCENYGNNLYGQYLKSIF